MKMNTEQEFELAETPLTDEQLAQFKPIEQVLPTELLNILLKHTETRKKARGKQKAPTKQAVSLRLSPEVITAFKATGKGWQSRINDTLLKAIKTLEVN
ncbi:BrnA antitoxin family protein [Avibacterium paragallinarum]|uniref:BrnA antitoxin family protein n=1 Tax=Avibacterium paragallinarum TaxID=728 RepID=A0AAE5TG83_AVIPA|nr:BrnA antitoxin family protein [Avibacterium paragallinarum]MEE3609513.1 BrnA antitoxin family protein [Avibacterium paragallinarum]MEE3622191.1 BrnA antitoxin family protein [Avibacterium paragallinarum]MEE3669922.1 BrnA antitoxin family protein [Avibacterium paragallinarum]MEE3681570.1 BrnA antitoxin family protein [Avibacterium paragallinarum]MEE4386895.1 BrnA antitoxin family protein [Avibacterium paragallinarum]